MAVNEIPPTGDALMPAAKLIQDASGVEETRFNNLNTRAVALLSASSVVTALVGFFAKDLLTTDALVDVVAAVSALTGVTIVALLTANCIILKGVLLPGGRLLFGDNEVVNPINTLTTAADVQRVQWSEYRQILDALQTRNSGKAKALNAAYWAYGVALLAGVVAVLVILWNNVAVS